MIYLIVSELVFTFICSLLLPQPFSLLVTFHFLTYTSGDVTKKSYKGVFIKNAMTYHLPIDGH